MVQVDQMHVNFSVPGYRRTVFNRTAAVTTTEKVIRNTPGIVTIPIRTHHKHFQCKAQAHTPTHTSAVLFMLVCISVMFLFRSLSDRYMHARICTSEVYKQLRQIFLGALLLPCLTSLYIL